MFTVKVKYELHSLLCGMCGRLRVSQNIAPDAEYRIIEMLTLELSNFLCYGQGFDQG